MQSNFYSRVLKVTLTIFAMLFGAGNLMFPPKLGIEMGQHTLLGFFGFFLSGVVLPMIGLLTIVAFEGNYQNFFGRLGRPLGSIFIFLCMLIIGPLVVMPRIIMLSYAMLKPFLPYFVTSFVFSFLFAGLAFLATFRPGKLLTIVGDILSPLKILTLITIVGIGVFSGSSPEPVLTASWDLFSQAFSYGYLTLDVLGSIFFGAIIVNLLTQYASTAERISMKDAMSVTAVSSVFAGLLLGGVYLGMTLLGAYHGQGLGMLDEGEIFSMVAFRVLGSFGAAFIGVSVFLACFTTCVSLSAVVGEYLHSMTNKRLPYAQSVGVILITCALIASAGLKNILCYSMPLLLFIYPLIIVITLCNLAYKLWGFKPILTPVALTAVALLVYKFNVFVAVASLCTTMGLDIFSILP